jgi:hypothetical protein
MSLPHVTTDPHFAKHDFEYPVSVEDEGFVALAKTQKGPCTLETNLESSVFQTREESVDHPLRDRHFQDRRDPPAHRKVLVRVEEVI